MNFELTREQQKKVEENDGLVKHIVNKQRIPSRDFDDVVSIGRFGLMKAVVTFDDSKGAKFGTYAAKCIVNEIFMSFRKSNKDQLVVSFEETIRGDLTLGDMLSDPKSLEFEEQLDDSEVIAKALSYVLNSLSRKIAIILLFSMAGITQKIIADMFEMSQAQVSRIIKKNRCKLKNNYEEINNKEVFTVALKDDRLEIKFSTQDVRRFNQIFANFLVGINNVDNLQLFKVSCTKEQVVIYLPAEPESFAFLASIIKEIENFSMSFNGLSQISFENDEKEEPTGKENHTKMQNAGGNVSIAEKASNAGASITTTARSNSSISAQIREYILSKDQFFVKDIKAMFSTRKENVGDVIKRAKDEGLIVSDYRGHYIVKR